MTATTDGIHWLGHDSFRIDGPVTVYVDPWQLPKGSPPADVILVTHDHFDHLSADDIKLLAKADTVVVGPESVTSQVTGVKTVTVKVGDTVTVQGVTVTAVAAYNTNKFREPGKVFHPQESGYVGYVIEADGRTVFVALARRGERKSFSARDEFRLTLGNAGAVRVTVDGRALEPLGRAGQVVKDLRLPGPAARG